MTDPAWWQPGLIYQIYPRSFQDSDGDGIGDLEGIRRRLGYLEWLGVDAIWISPIYPSPMADFGYDITDYRGIHPIFGTLEGFGRLLDEAHGRGLKVILDFVPNHSSDEHPWFIDSRSARNSPRRHWYIWRDPAPDGGPPNNWLANFGGSAWTFDEATGQYYYHAFLPQQPDLNWRNPDVREAMFDSLRFWLDLGVDGFRVDVLWHLMKDPDFADNPANPAWRPEQPSIDRLLQVNSCDHPDIHETVAQMRAVVDAYGDRVLIGEIYLPLERLVAYYGRDLKGTHLPFNFQLIFAAWSAPQIARIIADYEAAVPEGAWPNWVLSNHDQKRIATRIGAAQSRVAAMLLLSLRGTPTLYYGDELGLENVPVPLDRIQDPWEKNEPGLGFGRDPARTPMPWTGSRGAGFTTGEPWLPLNPDWSERNVEALSAVPGSILNLYRSLIRLRRDRPALHSGEYGGVHVQGDCLAFVRRSESEQLLIALNLGHEPEEVILPHDASTGRTLLSTYLDRWEELGGGSVKLRPDEGVILDLSEAM